MNSYLIIGIGGAFGACLRHALSSTTLQLTQGWLFPLGTFLVNLTGCLLAGVFLGLAARAGGFPEPLRLFVLTGILGGFTTFSAFGIETVELLRRGFLGTALLYSGSTLCAGLLALFLAAEFAGRGSAG